MTPSVMASCSARWGRSLEPVIAMDAPPNVAHQDDERAGTSRPTVNLSIRACAPTTDPDSATVVACVCVPPTVERLDAVFLRSLPPVMSALFDQSVLDERWNAPSVLTGMSIGALACHLAAQIHHADDLLRRTNAFPVLPGGADEHYARAAWVHTVSPDDPANDQSKARDQAERGLRTLRIETAAAIERLSLLLESGQATAAAGLPWQGWALRRDDFLLTRLLELVVHGEDLALSLDIPAPPWPDDALAPVLDLLVRLSVRRHGRSAVLSALTRRERSQPISAF